VTYFGQASCGGGEPFVFKFSEDVPRGIRIASTKDGVITGFVPPSGPKVADKNSQMRVATDATGNLYVADFSTLLRKCIKK
jgi:hypothetical protein